MTQENRIAKQEAAFRCALVHEDEAIRHEYLAEVANKAALTYRGRLPLRIGDSKQHRTWAKHARQYAEIFLKEALDAYS